MLETNNIIKQLNLFYDNGSKFFSFLETLKDSKAKIYFCHP